MGDHADDMLIPSIDETYCKKHFGLWPHECKCSQNKIIKRRNKMAKYKTVGSIVKSKTAGENDYIKFSQDVSFKKGDTVSLENKSSITKRAEKLLADKKISEDIASKIKKEAEQMPDFVRFNLKVKSE